MLEGFALSSWEMTTILENSTIGFLFLLLFLSMIHGILKMRQLRQANKYQIFTDKYLNGGYKESKTSNEFYYNLFCWASILNISYPLNLKYRLFKAPEFDDEVNWTKKYHETKAI